MKLLILGLWLSVVSFATFGSDVMLTWEPMPRSDVSTYRIYYITGTTNVLQATNYVETPWNQIDVVIPSLTMGVPWTFGIKAVFTNGTETPFSDTVTYTPLTEKPFSPSKLRIARLWLEKQFQDVMSIVDGQTIFLSGISVEAAH
jgi:hypothetical protein